MFYKGDVDWCMGIFEKENYTIDDILDLLKYEVEESVHLDYKAGVSLEKNEKRTSEIAKDVSAFANADGGIIVYGILEKDHRPNSFSYVDGTCITKEWLEQVINSKVNKKIPGVEIYPFRVDGDLKKSIFLVKIPRSNMAPHMSSDHRYYKRYNFTSVPMEDYEVRDLYHRKNKSILRIDNGYLGREVNRDGTVTVKFSCSIQNVGREIETTYKLNAYITCDGGLSFKTIAWEALKDNINYTSWHNGVKISCLGAFPVFPEEVIDMCRFTVTFDNTEYDRFVENGNVRLLLLYSGGTDEKNMNVKLLR